MADPGAEPQAAEGRQILMGKHERPQRLHLWPALRLQMLHRVGRAAGRPHPREHEEELADAREARQGGQPLRAPGLQRGGEAFAGAGFAPQGQVQRCQPRQPPLLQVAEERLQHRGLQLGQPQAAEAFAAHGPVPDALHEQRRRLPWLALRRRCLDRQPLQIR